MDVVVFGAGSLGSLVGGMLARAHDVTLVGRDPHVTTVRAEGLTVIGALEFTVHPAATTEGTGLAADLALVTVKAFDTPAAADALATGDFDAVCSLQNGLGNEDVLAQHVASPVLAGTVTYGAMVERPGQVVCTGTGEVVLGAWEGGESALADRVGAALVDADIETTVASDMPRRLWEKLAVNAGINGVTALARVDNGAVLEDGANETATTAAREVARVAQAEGIDLDPATAAASTESVAERTAANASSMRADVEARRRTEVDAIHGAVVDRADASGVAVPVNRTLAALLCAWERGQGLRPAE